MGNDELYRDRVLVHFDDICRYVASFADEMADDVIQDTFEAAVKKAHIICEYRNINAVLRKIARDSYSYRCRREGIVRNAHKKVFDRGVEQELGDINDQIIRREDNEVLMRALDSLRDDYKKIIVLRFFFELPLVKVSEILNLKYQTTVSRKNAALKELRRFLIKDKFQN